MENFKADRELLVALVNIYNAVVANGANGGGGGLTGDFATETTLNAVLAKLITSPATEAKQDYANSALTSIANEDFATQTTLAAILAKLITSPATEAKQDTANTALATIANKDFATQVTLAAVLAKLIAAPSTEAKQDSLIALFPDSLGIKNSASSFPVALNRETATGVISIINSVPFGNATVNSAVEISMNGLSGLAVQVTGTYTGALTLQYTMNGTTWVTVSNTPFLNVNTGIYTATITSALQGIFSTEASGMLKARITALAAVTGSATITLIATSNTSIVDIGNALPAGANLIGNIGSITTLPALPAGVNSIGDVGMQYRANATGAANKFHLVSAATTNATIVKASSGRLLGWSIANLTASWRYVKLHNSATAPTAGVGVVQVIAIAPNSVRELNLEGGIAHTLGISITTTTGLTDADNTAVALGDLIIDLFYQ